MVKSTATIMAVAIVILARISCLEAQSSMGSPMMSPMVSPMMSPGAPTAMAPAPDCMTALTNVSDCLTFVAIGSNLTTPDKNCCPEFAGLLESSPICLCELIGSAEGYGIDINRALMLPDACKLQVPPLDACPVTPSPAPTFTPSSAPTPGSIGESPQSEAPGSTAGGPAGSDGGLGMSPTASGNSGNGASSSTAVHDLSTLICLVAAIFIAYYF